MPLYKNIASQKLAVYAWDESANSPKTGDATNITAQISLDGGATAAVTDTNPAELDSTDAPGIYLFDLAQGETNGNLVIASPVSSTVDVTIEPVIIYTIPGDSVAIAADAIEISGDSVAADNAESFFDGTGYAGTNNVIPTVTALTSHTPQTGDSFARLAAPVGASVSADIAAIKSETAEIVADTNELQTDDVPGLIAALNDPTAAAMAVAVWNEARSGLTGAGTIGQALNALVAGDYEFNKSTGVETIMDEDGNTVKQRTVTDTDVLVTKS